MVPLRGRLGRCQCAAHHLVQRKSKFAMQWLFDVLLCVDGACAAGNGLQREIEAGAPARF